MSSTDFFISQSILHAKEMTLKDSKDYLRGLLQIVSGSDQDRRVRDAFNAVTACDLQLELIAAGQMTLPLAETKKGQRK